jgi:iron complex outermembrane recepter protein
MAIRCEHIKVVSLHLLSLTIAVGFHSTGVANDSVPTIVIRGQSEPSVATEQILAPLKSTSSVTVLRPNELPYNNATRIEDLADQVPGMQARTTDAGLTSAVNIRGFVTSKHYINGLPDVQKMFVRDLYTVDDVQIMRGANGIVSGNSSPGGTVWYSSSLPTSLSRQMATVSIGNDLFKRIGIDLNAPISETFAMRLVGIWKDGVSNPGGLTQESSAILASGRWRYSENGNLAIEVERTNTHQPFSFGTIISNGEPRYNQLYASPAEYSSRVADRRAIHWAHAFPLNDGASFSVRADLQKAEVHRDESLIGFYTITSATKLSGYYTKYVDNFNQLGSKVEAEYKTKPDNVLFSTRVGIESGRQSDYFTGVQNIGGFSVDIQNPNFANVNISALALKPRFSQTLINERGIYLLQSAELANVLNFSLGVRRTTFDSKSYSTAGIETQTTKGRGDVFRASVSLMPKVAVTPYVSYSEGFQPNTGLMRSGSFLDPQRSHQWELGAQWKAQAIRGSVAAYRIRLQNLPVTDPLDKAFFLPSGERQAQGIEAVTQASLSEAWKATALVNLMATRNIVKTSTTQGNEFASIPKHSATLRIENRFFWLQAQGVGQRWLNSTNTVALKGYGLWNTGLIYREKQYDVSASVSNLLNRNYVLSSTDVDDVYQGAKRRVWVTFRGRL